MSNGHPHRTVDPARRAEHICNHRQQEREWDIFTMDDYLANARSFFEDWLDDFRDILKEVNSQKEVPMSYRLIAFTQGEGAEPFLQILDEQGPQAAMDALAACGSDDQPAQEDPFWGSSDTVHSFDDGHHL